MSKYIFECIDAHTCGNPVRLILTENPKLKGNTMSEKRLDFLKNHDWIRKSLMFEPRGHDMMSGGMIYPPENLENDFSILFLETSGCLPMCGHGLIGAITILLEEKLVLPKTNGTLRVETPAGLVVASYEQIEGKVKMVKFKNVPSFLAMSDLEINCSELGVLKLDISYGGNFYAIIDIQKNFSGISKYSAAELIRWSREIREKVNANHSFEHPLDKNIKGCSHVLWGGISAKDKSIVTNAVFYGDKAIDRSPCGTGTSARMAQRFSKGKLKLNEDFIHESIIGSKFIGRVEAEAKVGSFKGVIPSIQGNARIIGYNKLILDPDDPYVKGFQVL